MKKIKEIEVYTVEFMGFDENKNAKFFDEENQLSFNRTEKDLPFCYSCKETGLKYAPGQDPYGNFIMWREF